MWYSIWFNAHRDTLMLTGYFSHVDIRYFTLLEWSESGQIKAEAIPTTDENLSDSMTKATGRIKFHQHADLYMGRTPPH